MRKVDFNLRNSYEFIANYKELQKAFDSQGIDKVRVRLRLGQHGEQGRSLVGAGRDWCPKCCPGLLCHKRYWALHLPAIAQHDCHWTSPSRRLHPCQVFLPEALSKGKMQDNNEFMQWFYGYWQQ